MIFKVSFFSSGSDVEDSDFLHRACKNVNLDSVGARYRGYGAWELPNETIEHVEKLEPETLSFVTHVAGYAIVIEDGLTALERFEIQERV